MPPTFGAALGLGLSALRRQAWLLAPGLVVAIARRVLTWPALAVAWALLARGALLALSHRPLDPGAALAGAAATASSPRFLALVGGLWLAGVLCGAALRGVWLAGALPTLAGAAVGEGGTPRFAAGVAYGTPRVLAASLLGLVLDLSAGLFALTLALGALRITLHAAGGNGSAVLALAVAGALTLAIAVPLALSVVADAAVARAALRAEGPARAFASAVRRFLARPGTFVLAAMVFGFVASLAPATVEAFGGAATGLVKDAPALLLAGPNLMLAVAAAGVAALVDLAWLGTLAALVCADARD
ncbi:MULTISPECIES: hypothetical protein [unclassified Anaeromyxobacter]|uniref:hypothetical protein n=1 Tax=unclassified Anaeromyxobacter TaxID=2620896 RepID=UPI001F5955D7|nr:MULTISPECIES: hypothetical protein [unclassified Anaeromyxobacter]